MLFLYRAGCVAGRQEGREGTGAWHGGKRICYILFWRWFYISQQQLTFHWQAWFTSCWPGEAAGSRGRSWGWGMAEELQRQMELELVTCAQLEIS